MPRREGSYDVVYVTRPREPVYEPPRRAYTSREYDSPSYASRGHVERRKYRDDYSRNEPATRESFNDYDPAEYYQPSRASRDSYQSHTNSEDRRGSRFAPASEDYSRRRRSPDDYSRRRPESPDDYYSPRRDRGRPDDRRSSPSRRLRSAMRSSRNDSPEAQQRARARSVSFREREADRHDAGNQKHQRPGYEARAIGQYLRHDDDDDLASETYAIRRKSRRYS